MSDSATSLLVPGDSREAGCCARVVPWETTKRISRIVLGLYSVLLTALFVCAAVELSRIGVQKNTWALFSGAIPVLIAVPWASYSINAHVQNYVSPLQRYYIRIIFLVPLYALNAWFALFWKESEIVWDVARECYEAYVLHSIGSLILEFLDWRASGVLDESRKKGAAFQKYLTDQAQLKITEAARAGTPLTDGEVDDAWRSQHSFFYVTRPATTERSCGGWLPIGAWLPAFVSKPCWRVDTQMVPNFKIAIFLYVFVRVMCAAVTFLTAYTGHYCEGDIDFAACAWPWVQLFVTAAQFNAGYWIFFFYFEYHDLLEPLHPLGKILSVKFVLFLSFWQATCLSAMSYFGIIHDTADYKSEVIVGALQNFL